ERSSWTRPAHRSRAHSPRSRSRSSSRHRAPSGEVRDLPTRWQPLARWHRRPGGADAFPRISTIAAARAWHLPCTARRRLESPARRALEEGNQAMERMLVVVFDSETMAHEATRVLQALDEAGFIAVYADGVIIKGRDGTIRETKA